MGFGERQVGTVGLASGAVMEIIVNTSNVSIYGAHAHVERGRYFRAEIAPRALSTAGWPAPAPGDQRAAHQVCAASTPFAVEGSEGRLLVVGPFPVG